MRVEIHATVSVLIATHIKACQRLVKSEVLRQRLAATGEQVIGDYFAAERFNNVVTEAVAQYTR